MPALSVKSGSLEGKRIISATKSLLIRGGQGGSRGWGSRKKRGTLCFEREERSLEKADECWTGTRERAQEGLGSSQKNLSSQKEKEGGGTATKGMGKGGPLMKLKEKKVWPKPSTRTWKNSQLDRERAKEGGDKLSKGKLFQKGVEKG